MSRALTFCCILGAALVGLVVPSAGALDLEKEVNLQEAEVGTPYEFEFEGEAGCQPYHFAYLAGSVPGLVVTEDGLLTGIPTQEGYFTFWVQLTDGIPGGACTSPMPSQAEFTLYVARRVVITATTLPNAKLGVPYRNVVTATGGGTLSWKVIGGSLPPGLALSESDGTLSGTPTAAGTFNFTLEVGDYRRKRTQDYAFVVAPPVAVAGATLPVGEVGMAFTGKVTATGGLGPLAWGGTFPVGLQIDAQGNVRGTPSGSGTFSVPVTVTDSDGQAATANASLLIAARLAIPTIRPVHATVGRHFTLRIRTRGGVPPRAWSAAARSLPRGVTLGRQTGTLRGTPRSPGTYRIVLRLTDKLGASARRTVVLTVRPAA